MTMFPKSVLFFNKEKKVDLQIIKLNNKFMYVSFLDESPFLFKKEDVYTITHTVGQFVYLFTVLFSEFSTIVYKFEIKHIEIIKNVRRDPRINVDLDAIYWVDEQLYHARILDISNRGVKIETEFPLTREIVELFFKKEKEMETAKGEVVWKKKMNNKFQYGIQFFNV